MRAACQGGGSVPATDPPAPWRPGPKPWVRQRQPWPFSISSIGQAYGLGLGVGCEGLRTEVPPKPGLLVAAEREIGIYRYVGVHIHGARLDPRYQVHGAVEIVGPDAG